MIVIMAELQVNISIELAIWLLVTVMLNMKFKFLVKMIEIIFTKPIRLSGVLMGIS